MSPTNGVWNSGNFLGAPGMDNFAGIAPVNSTFDIAFIQHEPGALCTTPIDCPFQQNYDDCLRYYQKTYDYGTAVGTVTSSPGVMGFVAPGAIAVAFGTMKFHKPMAKTPTVTLYNWNTGAANSVYDYGGISHASATASNVNSTGFSGISFTTAVTGAMGVYAHYTSDTGW
jgi:hypothetical protein